jgi:hypothetical protein
MNWICMVYGACLTDYMAKSDTRRVNEILAEALASESQQQHHPILTTPFYDALLILAGYVLAMKFIRYWLDYFSSRSRHGVRLVSDTILAEYPLYQTQGSSFSNGRTKRDA